MHASRVDLDQEFHPGLFERTDADNLGVADRLVRCVVIDKIDVAADFEADARVSKRPGIGIALTANGLAVSDDRVVYRHGRARDGAWERSEVGDTNGGTPWLPSRLESLRQEMR